MNETVKIRNKKTGEVVVLRRKNKETQEPTQQKQPEMQQQNILGQIFNVPGAAVRSAIQGKGYTQGAVQPDSVPTFQSMQQKNPVLNTLAGGAPIGAALDMATNPADVLMFLAGGSQFGSMVRGAKKVAGMAKIDSDLIQSAKAKTALDSLRKTLGEAKSLAIKEVEEVPVEMNLQIKSARAAQAIKNPVYEVMFDESGLPVRTVGNMDKVKNALGDLVSSPQMWEEAPKTEIQHVKKVYGEINQAMKDAAKSVGKDIETPLNSYGEFMDNYHLINKTLTDKVGNNVANKLRKTFQVGSEPAVKEAWKEVSKASPEIKQVMNSMGRRTMLRNILGISAVTGAEEIIGPGIIKKTVRKISSSL